MAKLARRLRPRPPISSSEICPQTARCTILIEFPEERFAFAAYAVETAWWAALEKNRFSSPAAPLSDEATHRAVFNEFNAVLSTLQMRQERIELPTLGL